MNMGDTPNPTSAAQLTNDVRTDVNTSAFDLKTATDTFSKSTDGLFRDINLGMNDAEANIKRAEAELKATSGKAADQLGDAVVEFLVGEE